MNSSVNNSNKCIHHLFELAADRYPERIAISDAGESISYGELNKRANRLASGLRRRGVGPEVLVGLCCKRSASMVVGVLAILKAGGGYVPLDHTYPRERLNWLLEDSGVRTILVDAVGADVLAGNSGEFLFLDDPATCAEGDENVHCAVAPHNVCYVIYTSGSTGKPKGVVVEHDSVVKLFESTQDLYQYSQDDVWSLFHSIGFDFSVWEMWGALFYGGRLAIVSQEAARVPELFYELLVAEKVTILNQTPSAFRQLTSYLELRGSGETLIPLRLVIFGGESLNPRNLVPWFEHYGDAAPQFVNMYGITETTVFTTYYPLSKDEIYNGTGSPIGKGIATWEVYLVAAGNRLAEVGETAEIYVAGPGVTRGYLNRADLTAERFVVDPFGGHPGKRFYRSGDFAVLDARGVLSYVGRQDKQVKIRGFRIELGEVENTLLKCEYVVDVAVSAFDFTETEKRIVAYYIANEKRKDLKLAEITQQVASFSETHLPPQMRPSTFIPIDSIPITSHGKLDTSKLPSPKQRPSVNSVWSAPTSYLATAIAAIWERQLGIHGVGTRDNFFDLGGSSLAAFKMIVEVQEKCGIQTDVKLIARGALTIDAMLQHAEKNRPSAAVAANIL